MPPIALWPLLLSVTLLVGAVWLLRRSWWPRRIGATRHCRRCEYNVDAIQSERCPECGSVLTPASVVHGQRRRRLGMALLAVAMLLCGLALGGLFVEQRWLHRIDWFHYRPFAWLLSDLDRVSDSPGVTR